MYVSLPARSPWRNTARAAWNWKATRLRESLDFRRDDEWAEVTLTAPAAVGVRHLRPLPDGRLAGLARRRAGVVVLAGAAIGLLTGLVANGGGFLRP